MNEKPNKKNNLLAIANNIRNIVSIIDMTLKIFMLNKFNCFLNNIFKSSFKKNSSIWIRKF